MENSEKIKEKFELKNKNSLIIYENNSFEINYVQKARQAYLWVILIMFPLPLLIIISLIFNVFSKMALFFLVMFIFQTIISVFTVFTMKPEVSYRYNSSNSLISYSKKIFTKGKTTIFANAKNFKIIFVCAQTIGKKKKYLVYQLRAIYADGSYVKLSSIEVGSPENLNNIGRKISEIIGVEFYEASDSYVSKIVKKLGRPISYYIKNEKIK